MQFNREQQIQTLHPDKKRPQMETKNEIQNVMERMGAKGERGRAFISDSNRADREHPGGQHAQSREQPKQTKGLFKLGEFP